MDRRARHAEARHRAKGEGGRQPAVLTSSQAGKPNGTISRSVTIFSQHPGDPDMGRFNLSAWAVQHPPLVLFMILMLAAAGAFSYLKLGRAEDPNFTIKVAVV